MGLSWLAAIYAMMPNDTDLTIFLDAGYNGINFAMTEGVEHYHMPTDSYEYLDKSSAWQYLRTTLALADYAAHNTTDELRQPSQNAVYFPFMPGVLILMSAFVSHILCATACALALVFVVRETKNKRLKVLKAIRIGLLVLMSIITAIFFTAGSYLFYIPLFVTIITRFLKERRIAYTASRMLYGITVLLLWVPVVFLLWVLMIQPMLL